MATFDQNITAIKQAQYGYEVRDAIAEGLQQCYDNAAYPSLHFEEVLDNDAKKITIEIPNNRKIVIYTNQVVSGDNYSAIGYVGNNDLIYVCCYYANCTSNPTSSIKNLNDGSVLVTLNSSLSYVSRKTKIRVGYDAIETSLLVTSTSQYSGGSGTFPEIKLSRVSYSGGFSATGTWYPGTMANPKYIPLVMTDFGGPGECLTSTSSVPTSFDGHNLYRDISTEGRTGSHFYTRFVYS